MTISKDTRDGEQKGLFGRIIQGAISISSELSKGAVVTIKFPLEMLA